jgi:hypothetical protein
LAPKGIFLESKRYTDSILFADDQVHVAEYEDHFQHNVMKLKQISQVYDIYKEQYQAIMNKPRDLQVP